MMSSEASTSDNPSMEKTEEFDMYGPAYLFSFYRYAEMYNWSEDCLQRFKNMEKDTQQYGAELCRVFKRIILYYESMEQSINEYDERMAAGSNGLAAESSETTDDSIESPNSPMVHAEVNETVIERANDEPMESNGIEEEEEEEEENDEFMEEIEEEEEVTESMDEPVSSSPAVERGNNEMEREEERMEREQSVIIYRTVTPRIPPPPPSLKTCKIELRDNREEEKRVFATESSAASSSHFDLSRNSLPSNGFSSSKEPVLRVPKMEPPENPFISPPTPPPIRPMRQATPPRLRIKGEQISPSTVSTNGVHSLSNGHNHNSSLELEKRLETADRLNALVNSFAFVPPTVQSPPSFSSPQSSSHSHSPSHPMIGQPSTSYSIQSRGRDEITLNTLLQSKLMELNDQIIQINNMKKTITTQNEIAFRLAITDGIDIGTELHYAVYDDFLSIDAFNNEISRISNEIRSHVRMFDALGIPSGDYLRISNMTVGNKIESIRSVVENHLRKEENELERIRKNVTDKVFKKVKTPQKSPFGFKRKDPKMSAISQKAKELAVRNAEKRKRIDSSSHSVDENESEKKKRMKERREERGRREGKERREERERRESSEEATTSREKRNDKDSEKVEKQWCAFCASQRFHSAIDCSKYKTWNDRKMRISALKLCIHCLDTFDPLSCRRKEHQILCTNCHKHISHPSLCKHLRPQSNHFIKSPIRYKKNFTHSSDRRTGRKD